MERTPFRGKSRPRTESRATAQRRPQGQEVARKKPLRKVDAEERKKLPHENSRSGRPRQLAKLGKGAFIKKKPKKRRKGLEEARQISHPRPSETATDKSRSTTHDQKKSSK